MKRQIKQLTFKEKVGGSSINWKSRGLKREVCAMSRSSKLPLMISAPVLPSSWNPVPMDRQWMS